MWQQRQEVDVIQGHEPRNVAFRNWKRKGNRLSPLSLQEEPTLLTLILAQWDWFQISELQNCKRINLCYLGQLRLWQFVTAAMRNWYTPPDSLCANNSQGGVRHVLMLWTSECLLLFFALPPPNTEPEQLIQLGNQSQRRFIHRGLKQKSDYPKH